MVSLQAALAVIALSGPGTGQTVLLDFYSDACGPCRAMDPTVRALAAKGYPVRKVNVNQQQSLAAQYGVRSIPCFVMLVGGQEVDRVVGGTTYSRLERMCKLGLPGAPQNPVPSLLAEVDAPKANPKVSIPAVQSPPPFSTAAAPPSERQLSTPGWTPRAAGATAFDADLIAATARLRIEDLHGHSCGSGTIIDARQGEALILTCGHIFRDCGAKPRIDVDLFGSNQRSTVPGNLICYDLQRDVGLVSIRVPGPVNAARVAPPGYRVRAGDAVSSAGCNHGNVPTVQHSRVTSVDRYQGPPNLQVAGQSVQGRSGGGIFSGEGLVVGVCNAAEPIDNEAFCAALGAVHAELDRAGLSHIYKPRPGGSEPRSDPAPATADLVAVDPPPMPKRMPPVAQPDAETRLPSRPLAASARGRTDLDPSEQAALDEICRRLGEGAEVICVVRSRRDPQAKSEIIMLDKVSPRFLHQLLAETRSQDPRRLTSLDIPRRQQTSGNPPAAETRPLPTASSAQQPAAGSPGNWAENTGCWRPRSGRR